jgi:hypothetical protein
MSNKFIKTVKGFRWQQWAVLVAFVLVLGFIGQRTFHTYRAASYWRHHRDEPIHGWMRVGYVAHSYHVPPRVLYEALGLPHQPPDRRPLRAIAKAHNQSLDEVIAILQEAIADARSSRPPPSPPPRADGGPQ